MTLQVIGAGVGRTGTHALKLALEHLGLGPTHHMEEVLKDPPRHIPMWIAAAEGRPDWEAAYSGFASAVDWPTASFWKELSGAYPKAKVILTVRSPESWAESFSETINKLMAGADQAPPHMQPFMKMATGVLGKAGFIGLQDRADMTRAFNAHVERVRAGVPADRLLVFEVKDGWDPLCRFLAKPVPADPFPRTNNRADFWERLKGG